MCIRDSSLDIQQAYPFSIETLPVPTKLKVGETAEIRCQLVGEGYYQPTTYRIRYFQPDGKGKLEMDNGTVFLPKDTKATIRCIPFDSYVEGDKEPGKCMVTGKPSACRVVFARSY